jgi:hypothetical protein
LTFYVFKEVVDENRRPVIDVFTENMKNGETPHPAGMIRGFEPLPDCWFHYEPPY